MMLVPRLNSRAKAETIRLSSRTDHQATSNLLNLDSGTGFSLIENPANIDQD